MATELDLLMDEDPLNLTAENLDQIVAIHREQRQKRESGVKPTKESGPKLKLSNDILGTMLKDKPKNEVVIKRRI